MYIIGTILFCLNLCIALASNCENLSGLWQNQLGSNMTILYRTDNHITGEYSTAVESKMRAALVTSNPTGIHIPVDGGAFLFLSGPARKDGKSMECEKNIQAGVGGHWVSERSNSLQFNDCYESGIFSGVNEGKDVIGRTDGGGPFTALGFVSASTESITGWTGHIHESPTEKPKKFKLVDSHLNFSNSRKESWAFLPLWKGKKKLSVTYTKSQRRKKNQGLIISSDSLALGFRESYFTFFFIL
ncbi:hypothetical protein HNY73_009263 [Argiope bruennichi]|uniref:Uncharacterized protein n=1 Tax=Argiope bruennichi TaxID=94029 RepID=A0A8T0FE49_ARGBR|nr:hypothetical protein HNY73_009263 [Argiope bruennichi]